ncbi:probable carboxylesterase 2 [Chenopodium quinoa]|uniref:Alpha/beta hydrolase fold-3 domain-containing protein n=1 Tax=Chenopodium quinoa TaxID=63459 RepID=A0A803LL64_CHEQI|nr:probable carboxylesterase 2 [Chenopodium quinoa]
MDPSSVSTKREVAHDVFPYLVEYKDGTIERLAGTNHVPPGFDPTTRVTSKDVVLVPNTCLSARLYRPTDVTTCEKLPIVLYFHGGAFLIASPAEPVYHNFCNLLSGSANALVVSLDYRLAPENPLPTAFDDAWAAIKWVAAHANESGPEDWLNQGVDFNKFFLAGDSAGATMAHHLAARMVEIIDQFKIYGIILIHRYFWSSKRIGLEQADPVRKELVDKWWEYVCPSDKGCDDPLINPFVEGTLSLDQITCEKMLVLVAEKDILRDRGRLYYEAMSKHKKVEYFETLGEDHVFYIFNPHVGKA